MNGFGCRAIIFPMITIQSIQLCKTFVFSALANAITSHIPNTDKFCIMGDAWLDKQGRQKPAKNIVETWEDMRLEVGAQASGNRHEPQYSDNSTKLFSLNDIDEIIEKISEKQDSQNLANSAKTCKVEKKPHNICDTCENRYGCISPCPVKLVGQTSDWSEEDEQYLLVCKNALAKYQTTDKWDAGIISHWLEDRLKSLKERYTWKPSDEQMELLREVQQALLGKDCHNRFVNFMCDLKKLKG